MSIVKPDQVFADVARTFELRHIICHEIASAYKIEATEVARCFESCVAFLRAVDELISETIHPDAPLTQTEMNIAAGESLREKEKLMEGQSLQLRRGLNFRKLRRLMNLKPIGKNITIHGSTSPWEIEKIAEQFGPCFTPVNRSEL